MGWGLNCRATPWALKASRNHLPGWRVLCGVACRPQHSTIEKNGGGLLRRSFQRQLETTKPAQWRAWRKPRGALACWRCSPATLRRDQARNQRLECLGSSIVAGLPIAAPKRLPLAPCGWGLAAQLFGQFGFLLQDCSGIVVGPVRQVPTQAPPVIAQRGFAISSDCASSAFGNVPLRIDVNGVSVGANTRPRPGSHERLRRPHL